LLVLDAGVGGDVGSGEDVAGVAPSSAFFADESYFGGGGWCGLEFASGAWSNWIAVCGEGPWFWGSGVHPDRKVCALDREGASELVGVTVGGDGDGLTVFEVDPVGVGVEFGDGASSEWSGDDSCVVEGSEVGVEFGEGGSCCWEYGYGR
jgi:hypothetical protein